MLKILFSLYIPQSPPPKGQLLKQLLSFSLALQCRSLMYNPFYKNTHLKNKPPEKIAKKVVRKLKLAYFCVEVNLSLFANTWSLHICVNMIQKRSSVIPLILKMLHCFVMAEKINHLSSSRKDSYTLNQYGIFFFKPHINTGRIQFWVKRNPKI